MKYKKIVEKYFNIWINPDVNSLESIFAHDIYYIESHGPSYSGLEQLKSWFIEWNNLGKVTTWNITNFIQHNNLAIVEWHFACRYEQTYSEFNGISLFTFDIHDKIIKVKEFRTDYIENDSKL